MVFIYVFKLRKCECLNNDKDVTKDWKYDYVKYYSLLTSILFIFIFILRIINFNININNKKIYYTLSIFSTLFFIASIIQAYSLFVFMRKIHLEKKIAEYVKQIGCKGDINDDCECRDGFPAIWLYYYSTIIFVLYIIGLFSIFIYTIALVTS